jgi:formylglycine-generating enzyme
MEPREVVGVRDTCLDEDEALHYVSSSGGLEKDLALEKHIDACDSCRVMLSEAARAMSASGLAWHSPEWERAERPLASPTSLAVGDVLLSRYTIVRFVARGGMGEVYEAYDDVLAETVALKTIVCTDLDQPAAMQRFRAEVRLARQVTHPNVCRIYEFGMHLPSGWHGQAAEPVPFLTMEFLRGETMDRRLAREGPFAEAEVARLIPHLTAGLGAIHGAGIIHCDIKPANIALLPGPPERLVLMDFGLARFAKVVEASQSLSGGRLVGTVNYMAPEQLGGQPATRSVDIYSLGLVIFEMLTGQRPFAGENVLAAAVGRMMRPVPKPTALVPTLDPQWDLLIARCLAPEPAQRLASVDEIVPPRGKPPRSRPPPSRRGWGTRAAAAAPRAGLALLVLAVAAGGAFLLQETRQPPGKAMVSIPKGPPAQRKQRAFTASGCSADMVRVAGRFCIDRFEAAAVDDQEGRTLSPYYPPSPDLLIKMLEDWNRRIEGGTTGAAWPPPELPAWQREFGWRPLAVSRPGVTPQGYVNQIIAAVACAGAGKRLCTTDEWRTACRGEKGTMFPYGPTYQPGLCNISRGEHPAEMLHIDYTDGMLDPRMNQISSQRSGPLLRPTGSSAACASRWGDDAVHDMVGNLDEWSADGNGVLLGGFYSRQSQDGCESTNTKHPADFFNYSLGIRCCDRLH